MNDQDHYDAGKNNWVTGNESNFHYQVGQMERAREQRAKEEDDAARIRREAEMEAEHMKRMAEIRARAAAGTSTGTIRPSTSTSTSTSTSGRVTVLLRPGIREKRRDTMLFLAGGCGLMALCGAGLGHPGNYALMAVWTVGGSIAGYLGGFLLTSRIFWGLAIAGGVFYYVGMHFH